MRVVGLTEYAWLEIRRDLARKNPIVFNDDLAATLNSIAYLFREQKRFEDSENAYQEALEIRRDLANKNPEIFKDDLDKTLKDIASLEPKLRPY